MSQTGFLINCQNASFGYDGNVVVHNLNFSVHDGDFLLIAGENGSGKSTLIKGLLRLLTPIEGTISFGSDISKVGYLSQQVAAKQDFPAGVFEIILSGNLGKKGFLPFYSKADKHKAEVNMHMLGISELKNRCFRELSGGQQRRVLLARSLCAAEPQPSPSNQRFAGEGSPPAKLLVLDEPFAGLDPVITSELYLLLEKINRQMGMTIIMVSHDIETAYCAKNVLHLQKRQIYFGSMEEYRKSETGKKFFTKIETN